MRKLLLTASIGVLIISLFGCSGTVQVDKGTVEDSEIRSDYLAANPESPYAANIEKGEVRGGMNINEVKASWGMPNAIIVEDDIKNQYWVYYTRGTDSGSVMIYTLNFRKDQLEDWNIEIKRISSFFVEGEGAPGYSKITLVGEDKK